MGLDPECLRDLNYPSLGRSHQPVREALLGIFEWVWSNKTLQFRDWIQQGHGIYWISGKAGSGNLQ